jgi:hypothetical protein
MEVRPTPSDLLQALAGNIGRLIHDEVALASREFLDGLNSLRRGFVWLLVGGLMAIGGMGALVMAAALVLVRYLAPWEAALGAAVVFTGAGVVGILAGLNQLDFGRLRPRQTLETLREAAQLLREPR